MSTKSRKEIDRENYYRRLYKIQDIHISDPNDKRKVEFRINFKRGESGYWTDINFRSDGTLVSCLDSGWHYAILRDLLNVMALILQDHKELIKGGN